MSIYVSGAVMKNSLMVEVKINKTAKKSRRCSVDTLYHISMNMMTPKWKKNWCVGRIEALCIVSRIVLQLMKVASDFV